MLISKLKNMKQMITYVANSNQCRKKYDNKVQLFTY
jgi:hypothetical protein